MCTVTFVKSDIKNGEKKMKIIVKNSKLEAAKYAARLLAEELKAKPDAVFGLATGRTMEPLYAELCAIAESEKLDFSRARSFNLDEYAGLPGSDVNSYRAYMQMHLFDHVNFKETNLPDGVAPDAEAEAKRYDDAIKAAGLDVQLLGIGNNGHIGFNEPETAFDSRTRHVKLTEATIEQNQGLFPKPEDMPRYAFTMGIGTIMEAKKIILVATGSAKTGILAEAVLKPASERVPASVLQNHADVVIVADKEAAAAIPAEYITEA